MLYGHLSQTMLFSAGTLSDLRLWLLRPAFEHSSGSGFSRCLTSCGLGAFSWELVLFHSERQLCPWSTVEGTGVKGKVATFYCFPDVFHSTSHPPHVLTTLWSARKPAVPSEEREKSLVAVSLFCISHQKEFLLVLFF